MNPAAPLLPAAGASPAGLAAPALGPGSLQQIPGGPSCLQQAPPDEPSCLQQASGEPPALQPAAAELAGRILELPPLPAALAEAIRLLSHDELPAQRCVQAIERDPALALRVLQLANSGFYASPAQVRTVGDAVRLLGLREVAAVLAAVSLKQMLGRLHGALEEQDRRWHHALATACAARELARALAGDAEEAFVAGLLHDVGTWLLVAFAPEGLPQVKALQEIEGLDLCSAERRVFGLSHEDIGAQVARRWDFPAGLTAAIAHHHQPRPRSESGTEQEHLVHAAEALVRLLLEAASPAPPQGPLPGLLPEVRQGLGLDEALALQVLEHTRQSLACMEGM